jgi:hypothetical protein
VIAAGAAVLLGAAPARPADPVPCPIDGAPLALPAARAWNAGAGSDSDGCVWAIDAEGRRRVVGVDDHVTCGGCGAVFTTDPTEARLTPAQVAAVRAAVAADPQGARVATNARRLERAADTRRAALAALPGATAAVDAEAGGLLLRAAWAARAEAVLGGADDGYHPRTIAEARERLAALEERVRRGTDQDPGRAHLAAAEADIEGLRAALDLLEGRLPLGADQLPAARARHLLADLERRLLETRAHLAAGTSSEPGLELVLARAWTRFGDPARRDRWLDDARARHGPSIAAEVERVRRACAEEARLLGRARACFEAAAAAASAGAPDERARLWFLAGDAARRTGDAVGARALLERAVAADPQGRLAGAAQALLGS